MNALVLYFVFGSLERFFDLFYVAAAFNLAMIMKDAITLESLLYFFCCYLTVITIWYEKLYVDSRFATDDNLYLRAIEAIHLIMLGLAIQHIRPVESMKYTCEYATTFTFTLSISLIYMLHIGTYFDLAWHVVGGPEAVSNAKLSIQRKVLGALPVWVATCWAARDYYFRRNTEEREDICENGNSFPIILCGLSFFMEQVHGQLEMAWFLYTKKPRQEINVPMNLEFTSHRFGELTNLMLGESVLALIVVEESPGARYLLTFSAGIFAVTMLQYLYFRSQPSDVDDHVMRRSVSGSLQFFYSLVIYSASLILIGCSFKLILHQYLEEVEGASEDELETTTPRIIKMFSWSLASCFFFMDMMVISHRGWKANLGRMWDSRGIRWGPTLCTMAIIGFIVVTACLPFFISDLEMLTFVGCLILFGQVLMRTLGMRYFPVSRQAMEADAHR